MDSPLPPTWTWTTLGEISERVDAVNPKAEPTKRFIYLDIASIDNSIQRVSEPKVYYGKEAPSRARQLVKTNDILFSTVRTYLKNIALVDQRYDGHIASTGFCVIRASGIVNPKFLFHFVQTNGFLNLLSRMQRGTSYPAVRDSDVMSQGFPLPPLPEQRRIVEKIEALFSELDKGVEQLKTAAQQLKVYRQAVLKAAFEGKLTEKWRNSQNQNSQNEGIGRMKMRTTNSENSVHPENSDSDNLLTRIKQEREEQAKATGKKLKPIAPLTEKELAGLPALPEGWAWVSIESIAEDDKHSIKAGPFGSSLKKESYARTGYKIYGQEQVIAGDPDFGDYFIGKEKYEELKSCKVKPGDVLISLVGTIGKVLILTDNSQPGIINPRLVKISLNRKFYSPVFFKQYFESTFLRSLYALRAHGATMDVLNLGIIRGLPFPFCSMGEQHQIVQEIESRLSVCDKLEETIAASLQQSEALRQSILKKAFEGKLVEQCSDDPPASQLLEQIKRQKQEDNTGIAKRTKKATSAGR